MKAKIKDTGEIVELNEQGISLFEYVRGIYKDVNGNKYKVNELEFIEENPEKGIDWEQVRIKAAISALQGFASNPNSTSATDEELAKWSVSCADALIAELKKGGEK